MTSPSLDARTPRVSTENIKQVHLTPRVDNHFSVNILQFASHRRLNAIFARLEHRKNHRPSNARSYKHGGSAAKGEGDAAVAGHRERSKKTAWPSRYVPVGASRKERGRVWVAKREGQGGKGQLANSSACRPRRYRETRGERQIGRQSGVPTVK